MRARRRASGRRLLLLLAGVWIINAFDLALTLTTWRQSLMVELNPLAAKILPHGWAAAVLFKLGLLAFGTGCLWYCRQHPATEPAVWGYVILCVGLSFWWHQILAEANRAWTFLDASVKVAQAQP